MRRYCLKRKTIHKLTVPVSVQTNRMGRQALFGLYTEETGQKDCRVQKNRGQRQLDKSTFICCLWPGSRVRKRDAIRRAITARWLPYRGSHIPHYECRPSWTARKYITLSPEKNHGFTIHNFYENHIEKIITLKNAAQVLENEWSGNNFNCKEVRNQQNIQGVPKMHTHFKRYYLCITFLSWIKLR